MRRTPVVDKVTGFIAQVFRMETQHERAEYEKSVLRALPPGYANSVRWINDDEFVIGPVKVESPAVVAAAPPAGILPVVITGCVPTSIDVSGDRATMTTADDGLSKLDTAKLKVRCALAGISYEKTTSRGAMIALLRAAVTKGAGSDGGAGGPS
jgi:hypothetical protein